MSPFETSGKCASCGKRIISSCEDVTNAYPEHVCGHVASVTSSDSSTAKIYKPWHIERTRYQPKPQKYIWRKQNDTSK